MRHKLLARRFYHSAAEVSDQVYAAIWRHAASEVGGAVVDHGQGFLEIRDGQRSTSVWRQFESLDDVFAFRRSPDKEVVHRELEAVGLPLPAHRAFPATRLAPALELLRSTSGAWVVKPADGTAGGLGVTTEVRSPKDLMWPPSSPAATAGACLREAGGAIIEVDCTPGLAYHYHVREDRSPVAVPVLRLLLAQRPSATALRRFRPGEAATTAAAMEAAEPPGEHPTARVSSERSSDANRVL